MLDNKMIVFAVETSCDETSVCIIRENKKILSHVTYSQKDHIKFGGVIPELASRAHLQILQRISKKAILESGINNEDIDVVTATCGPGLIGCLLVGSTFAKSFSIGLNKPFVPINHLEGHLLSTTYNNNVTYPFISFLLTGGHTQIYLVKSINNYELLGETCDDAIGEAFDKIAKLLDLPYPGGPEIEKIAKNGDEKKFILPAPLSNKKDLNFSFSGIKTSINLIVKKNNKINSEFKSDMSASFQYTVTKILESKLRTVMNFLDNKKISVSNIALVGGVAANKYINGRIKKIVENFNCSLVSPPDFMLGDNAAMIGWACLQKNSTKVKSNLLFKANPRLSILGDNK
tara:strand:- start:5820 stop:6857 length:1038 start_codon:yes stop_codon:yes gene_type:complete